MMLRQTQHDGLCCSESTDFVIQHERSCYMITGSVPFALSPSRFSAVRPELVEGSGRPQDRVVEGHQGIVR